MGGRGGSSGITSGGFAALGLKQETSIDPELFNSYSPMYGKYAYQLARDIDEYGDEDQTIVSYTEGSNKAYAVLTLDDDESLDALISTGGRTGTKLLSKVMQYQQSQGKGLYWMVDNFASMKYYDSMGLGKFKSGKTHYEIGAADMKDAIKIVEKRLKK